MKLHTLKPAEGSTHSSKRIGRGQGSGKGGTSTKGHKGAQSRSGYSKKVGFEGGQMPLQRRVPKFGFRSPNRVAYKVINLDALEELAAKNAGKDIDITLLMEKGFAGKNDVVKILGRGELKAKVNVKVHAFSSTASKAIEAAGGTATTL
jgi:large subunit ribosomal protein L15